MTMYRRETFKVTLFVGSLVAILALGSIDLERDISKLLSGSLIDKPKLIYGDILSTEYMTSIEKYNNEQFVYSDFLIEDYYALNRLLSRNTFDDAYAFKKDDEIVTFNNSNVDNAATDLNLNRIYQMSEYLKLNDIPFYNITAPESGIFYLDETPDYFQNDSVEVYDHITSTLDNKGVKNINLYEYFNELSESKDSSLYYRLDNHWKTETAFDVYEHILAVAKADGNEFNDDVEFNKDIIEDIFSGAYGRKFAYGYRYLQKKDEYTVIYPKNDSTYTITDIFTNESYTGNYFDIAYLSNVDHLENYEHIYNVNNQITNKAVVNNNIHNGKTVLVLGDSFSKSITLYLTQNFETVINLDTRGLQSGQAFEYVSNNIENIDLVLGIHSGGAVAHNTSAFDYFGQMDIESLIGIN